MENSGISWTHNTQNFWVGCQKIAPECAHCYINRDLRKQNRDPWGKLYLTKTWTAPWQWQNEAQKAGHYRRVFTCSLSDFFHARADPWRRRAWAVIKYTPNLVWLVLTKRPERIEKHLPPDWPYPNVWLGVSTGCKQTLNKMDILRRIPVHEKTVRFVSAEPLLEDISQEINLDGFGWVVTGGESGPGNEYEWNSSANWRDEFHSNGRRIMRPEWAIRLRDVTKAAVLPFMFKQVTNSTSGYGYNALEGKDWHEFPAPPSGNQADWAPRARTPDNCKMKPDQWNQWIKGTPLEFCPPGETLEFLTKTGLVIAHGYVRVEFGGRGPYIEFTPEQIVKQAIHYVDDQSHRYYDEYRSNDASNVKLYFQRRSVSYAKYVVGKWYVSPSDVNWRRYALLT